MDSTATAQVVGEWRAVNLAHEAAGSVHDDAVAQRLGFRGGFVPGVTVVGYVVEAWRRQLGLPLGLRPFKLTLDLRAPVYDGQVARVKALLDGDCWRYAVETDDGRTTTEGTIEPAVQDWPLAAAPPEAQTFDGVDVGNLGAPERTFARAEVSAYYADQLQTAVPGDGDLPVSIGQWGNPLGPIIERLSATHFTIHRGSTIHVQRLPLADQPYRFGTSVEAIDRRPPDRAWISVQCDIIDRSGERLVAIQHRSAVRKRE